MSNIATDGGSNDDFANSIEPREQNHYEHISFHLEGLSIKNDGDDDDDFIISICSLLPRRRRELQLRLRDIFDRRNDKIRGLERKIEEQEKALSANKDRQMEILHGNNRVLEERCRELEKTAKGLIEEKQALEGRIKGLVEMIEGLQSMIGS